MADQQNNSEVKAPEGTLPQGYQQGAGIYFVQVPATQAANYPYLQAVPQSQPVPQPVPQQQRVFYQTNQYVPLSDETPVGPAVTTTASTTNSNCCNNTQTNAQQGGCQRSWGWKWGGCRRSCSYGQQQTGGCCWTPSNRPLGTVTEFFWNMLFATFVPIFAPLVVFSLETSQLARVGALYGTGDFFFALAAGIFRLAHSAPELHHRPAVWIVAAVSLLIALILFISACKRLFFYLWQYEQVVTKNKSEGETVVSDVGKRCEFVVSFLLSLFFPVIGTFLRVACRRTLQSRFGAMKGLAWFCIIIGALTGGIPVLVGGLFLHQFSKLHFQRAIISATAATSNNNASSV